MNKLSFKMKLVVGFGAVLLITALLGGIGYMSAVSTESVSRTVEFNSGKKDLSLAIQLAIEKEKVGGRDALLNGDMKYLTAARGEFAEKMGALKPQLSSEQSRKLFADTERSNAVYCGLADRAIELRRAGNAKEALDVFYGPDAQQARSDLKKSTTDLVDWYEKLKTEAVAQQTASDAHTKTLMLTLVLVGLAVGAVIAFLIGRSMASGLARIIDMTRDIAEGEGDLTKRLAITSQDELGELAKWFNIFLDKLHSVISQVAATAEHVASASEEISASATQMANGSETQKDQVHQIATAMQEMSATVHEVSENSSKAADSARQTSETARQGGAIVEDTLAHMRSIAGSVRETAQKVQELGSRSDQIGKIVGVIDDIADQTNLLALNAAIEAARAGDQGRGFAVVADEVRKLAERTTKATKEIAEMIQSVQADTRGAVEKMQSGTQQVEKGVEVTAKAGESLKQIIVQAEHVGEMVTHIATAANEQSSTTEQVNANMEQINKLVAESAQGAQQSAQACEQLSGLALELQNLVSRFRLANGTGHRQNSNRSQYRDRPARFDALPAPQPAYAGISSFSPGAARGSAAIDFSSARTKHNAWKTKLRAVLDGRLTMSESEAGSPKDCQLGKWLYSTGLSAYGHLFEMHELESTHSQMHASVREVLRAFHAGDRELAQREFQKVSELSSQVITLLTRIEQQVAADPGRARTALALTTRPPVQHALQHSGYDRHGE